jgi:predicted helicase
MTRTFHRQNNVAKELYTLENTFFTGKVKHDTLAVLRPYYAAIKSAAALVTSHHEKQNFLKTIYENFYKVYDKKKADRLGVIYTPNEIVRFMIDSADWLCQKHFGKALIDKQVEILDPAAGTGTFITELIEHFCGQPAKLRYKYLEELHANEVAILPYYVANLNIEATYAAINGYEEYPNLCFVDTLDNVAGLRTHAIGKEQHFGDLLGAMSEENVARIKRQNTKKISVIIGNPPYRANQLNENENNKNREYPEIDRRIKETYIKASTAQKTKLYDPYARFFRWASDRIDENGIVAFVSNSSFIDSRTYDGFRNLVAQEFNEIWLIDLKGNARTSGERRRREGGNVFHNEIRVGIAVYFCVKKKSVHGCRIRYQAIRDYAKSEEKREFLRTPINTRNFGDVRPDKDHNWINLADNDFDSLTPVADKKTKSVKVSGQERAIFKLFSMGVKTNRDDWVCDMDAVHLGSKVRNLVSNYESERLRLRGTLTKANVSDLISYRIKWTRKLKKLLVAGRELSYSKAKIKESLYRPFTVMETYFDSPLNEDQYQLARIPWGQDTQIILLSGYPSQKPFQCLATNKLFHHDTLDKTNCVSRIRLDKKGERLDNITDWALAVC